MFLDKTCWFTETSCLCTCQRCVQVRAVISPGSLAVSGRDPAEHHMSLDHLMKYSLEKQDPGIGAISVAKQRNWAPRWCSDSRKRCVGHAASYAELKRIELQWQSWNGQTQVIGNPSHWDWLLWRLVTGCSFKNDQLCAAIGGTVATFVEFDIQVVLGS